MKSFLRYLKKNFDGMVGGSYIEKDNTKLMGTPAVCRKTNTLLQQIRQGLPYPSILLVGVQDTLLNAVRKSVSIEILFVAA